MNFFNYLNTIQPKQNLVTTFGEDTVHIQYLGDLILTSGYLVACDPLAFPDEMPFETHFESGCYPVSIGYVYHQFINSRTNQLFTGKDNAFAMLFLNETVPAKWKFVNSYSVDGGKGCFMDANIAEAIADDERLTWTIIDRFDEKGVTNCNLVINRQTGGNVIAFVSGQGDGCYPCYFGYDERGNVVRVVTNFELDDSEDI